MLAPQTTKDDFFFMAGNCSEGAFCVWVGYSYCMCSRHAVARYNNSQYAALVYLPKVRHKESLQPLRTLHCGTVTMHPK